MTPAEQVEQVRAHLADKAALADTLSQHLPQWGAVAERCGDETDLDAGAYIAAVSPALMLRLVAHAEDVLGRHRINGWDLCTTCDFTTFPCPEVAAVIKAWTT